MTDRHRNSKSAHLKLRHESLNSREPTSIAWVRGDLTRDLADLEEQLAMAETAGPKIGDARSLWNFTPSPGWTKDECATLRLCLMKFGIGRWVQIVDLSLIHI